MVRMVLLRHGQSVWNLENRYTGWTDVDLTENGIEEARAAGRLLREAGLQFDHAFTSVLKRAIRSLWIVLDILDQMWLPIDTDWRLNERHYGALQGISKAASVDQYGHEQVFRWRRSFDVRPPQVEPGDPRHPRFDPRYQRLPPELLPAGESLFDSQARVLAFWRERLVPVLERDEQTLLVAHGNSLRALVMFLDEIPAEEVPDLNIPTGVPLVYEFLPGMKIRRRYYLGDPEVIRVSYEALRKQGMLPEIDKKS